MVTRAPDYHFTSCPWPNERCNCEQNQTPGVMERRIHPNNIFLNAGDGPTESKLPFVRIEYHNERILAQRYTATIESADGGFITSNHRSSEQFARDALWHHLVEITHLPQSPIRIVVGSDPALHYSAYFISAPLMAARGESTAAAVAALRVLYEARMYEIGEQAAAEAEFPSPEAEDRAERSANEKAAEGVRAGHQPCKLPLLRGVYDASQPEGKRYGAEVDGSDFAYQIKACPTEAHAMNMLWEEMRLRAGVGTSPIVVQMVGVGLPRFEAFFREDARLRGIGANAIEATNKLRTAYEVYMRDELEGGLLPFGLGDQEREALNRDREHIGLPPVDASGRAIREPKERTPGYIEPPITQQTAAEQRAKAYDERHRSLYSLSAINDARHRYNMAPISEFGDTQSYRCLDWSGFPEPFCFWSRIGFEVNQEAPEKNRYRAMIRGEGGKHSAFGPTEDEAAFELHRQLTCIYGNKQQVADLYTELSRPTADLNRLNHECMQYFRMMYSADADPTPTIKHITDMVNDFEPPKDPMSVASQLVQPRYVAHFPAPYDRPLGHGVTVELALADLLENHRKVQQHELLAGLEQPPQKVEKVIEYKTGPDAEVSAEVRSAQEQGYRMITIDSISPLADVIAAAEDAQQMVSDFKQANAYDTVMANPPEVGPLVQVGSVSYDDSEIVNPALVRGYEYINASYSFVQGVASGLPKNDTDFGKWYPLVRLEEYDRLREQVNQGTQSRVELLDEMDKKDATITALQVELDALKETLKGSGIPVGIFVAEIQAKLAAQGDIIVKGDAWQDLKRDSFDLNYLATLGLHVRWADHDSKPYVAQLVVDKPYQGIQQFGVIPVCGYNDDHTPITFDTVAIAIAHAQRFIEPIAVEGYNG